MTPPEPVSDPGGEDVSLLANDAPEDHVTAEAPKSKKS